MDTLYEIFREFSRYKFCACTLSTLDGGFLAIVYKRDEIFCIYNVRIKDGKLLLLAGFDASPYIAFQKMTEAQPHTFHSKDESVAFLYDSLLGE